MGCRKRATRLDQSAIRRAGKGRNGALDLARLAHVDRPQLDTHRRRYGLEGAELTSPRVGCIPEDSHTLHSRSDLFQQLQPFPADAVFELNKSGGIAARSRQAIDDGGADWVYDIDEHNRHSACRL